MKHPTVGHAPVDSTASGLSRKEAAAWLTSLGYPTSPRTLARLGAKKHGPRYRRFNWRTLIYSKDELLAWAKANTEEVGGR